MSIELDLPKDIRDYEPKFFLGLTLRQAICGGIGFTLAIISFNILKHFTDSSIKVIIPLVFILLAFLFGWVKRYNMPFEKYLASQLMTTIIPPKKRVYKIENKYQILEKEIRKEEAEKAKAEKAAQAKQDKENKKIKQKGGKAHGS